MSCRHFGTNGLGSCLFPGTWEQPPLLPGQRVPTLALKGWFLPLCIFSSLSMGLPALSQTDQQDAHRNIQHVRKVFIPSRLTR